MNQTDKHMVFDNLGFGWLAWSSRYGYSPKHVDRESAVLWLTSKAIPLESIEGTEEYMHAIRSAN